MLRGGGTSMRVTIDLELDKNGKSRYWLSKQIDCSYQNLCRLCNNESNSISFDLAERICVALNCTLDDIFKIDKVEE
jgi:putative transcriptional regulator